MSNAALVAQLLKALVETSTVTDHAASDFAGVVRANETLKEQALTLERVIKAVRAHFENLAQVHERLSGYLPAEAAAELEASASEVRGKLGIAAGALRRWTMGAQACTDSARQAGAGMNAVREAIRVATAAAEDFLVE